MCVCVCGPDDLSTVDGVRHRLALLVPNLDERRPSFAQVNVFIDDHPRHTRVSTPQALLPGTHTNAHTGICSELPPSPTEAARDSLKRGARPRIHGPGEVVVSGEGQDLGPAAGPHTPAVLPVQRLAQTHDRRVELPHRDGFNRLPVLLLWRGGRNVTFQTAAGYLQLQDEYRKVQTDLQRRVLVNCDGSISSADHQVVLPLAERDYTIICFKMCDLM